MSPELLVEFKSACLVLTRPRRAAPRKLCGFHAKFLGSGGYYEGEFPYDRSRAFHPLRH